MSILKLLAEALVPCTATLFSQTFSARPCEEETAGLDRQALPRPSHPIPPPTGWANDNIIAKVLAGNRVAPMGLAHAWPPDKNTSRLDVGMHKPMCMEVHSKDKPSHACAPPLLNSAAVADHATTSQSEGKQAQHRVAICIHQQAVGCFCLGGRQLMQPPHISLNPSAPVL